LTVLVRQVTDDVSLEMLRMTRGRSRMRMRVVWLDKQNEGS
jgi:hypothetical protein